MPVLNLFPSLYQQQKIDTYLVVVFSFLALYNSSRTSENFEWADMCRNCPRNAVARKFSVFGYNCSFYDERQRSKNVQNYSIVIFK